MCHIMEFRTKCTGYQGKVDSYFIWRKCFCLSPDLSPVAATLGIGSRTSTEEAPRLTQLHRVHELTSRVHELTSHIES